MDLPPEAELRETIAKAVDHWHAWTGYRLNQARGARGYWDHPSGVRGALIDEILKALREEEQ